MPDRDRNRHRGKPEFEVAHRAKERRRSPQREMLQKQLAQSTDNGHISGSHGEDAAPDVDNAPPTEDRAG